MRVHLDDYGINRRFTLKPIKIYARHARIMYYEINMGWFWFSLWVRKRVSSSPYGLPLTVELPDHREIEEEDDE